ncbi:MAG: hypothetical protein JWO94_2660 [Verrucomicrobiaceae bacterium]|nr:hypothetical protein [Verrucomicrobiaceae bacterium]
MAKYLILLTLVIVFCWVIWPENPSVSSSALQRSVGTIKTVFKVPSDMEWSSLSKSDMRDIANQVNGPKKLVNSDFETLVKLGESVVTEGDEPSPGIFVFSTLTPTLTIREDGSKVVQVNLATTQTDINGNSRVVSGRDIPMQPNGSRDIIIISNGRTFNITLSAIPDKSDHRVIRMRSRESSQANAL